MSVWNKVGLQGGAGMLSTFMIVVEVIRVSPKGTKLSPNVVDETAARDGQGRADTLSSQNIKERPT